MLVPYAGLNVGVRGGEDADEPSANSSLDRCNPRPYRRGSRRRKCSCCLPCCHSRSRKQCCRWDQNSVAASWVVDRIGIALRAASLLVDKSLNAGHDRRSEGSSSGTGPAARNRRCRRRRHFSYRTSRKCRSDSEPSAAKRETSACHARHRWDCRVRLPGGLRPTLARSANHAGGGWRASRAGAWGRHRLRPWSRKTSQTADRCKGWSNRRSDCSPNN